MEIAILPRWLIRLISLDYHTQNNYNILISNLMLIALFLLFRNSLISILNEIPHFCLFDYLLKIECPVCGTTRAFCEISKGNLDNAFYLNKTSIFVAVFFLFQIPLRIVSILFTNKTEIINKISKYFGRLILALIMLNWIIELL